MAASPHDDAGAGQAIRAPRGPLGELWASRWLLVQWIKRDFTVQYRQSLLGAAWPVVQTLLLLCVYGLIFTQVLDVEAPKGSYLVFALCGLAPWAFLASAIQRGLVSLSNAAPIIQQVHFPRAVVPLASTGVTVIDLCISTVLLLVVQLVAERSMPLSVLALLPIYLGLAMLLAGVCVVGSIIGVLVRDLRFAVPLVLQVGFIATPVMYPPTLAPEGSRWVYDINPMARTIEAVRDAVVEGSWPSAGLVVGLLVAGLAVLVASIFYAAAVEDRLVDVV
jgi:lipopolysaccharide transport system permease protein